MTQQIIKETARRRTFAIISHPDAGKTTLTEKLLLYGGAKDLAGGVRDRKSESQTSSDWLELEKQRGISVSSTLLQFEYKDYRINLLDTPGHKDFSEDTYRVLMAVDSAIMVLDTAKGIEDQTLKLFEVCRSRGIPIITFINKCDRPGKDPLELLDEIETRLGLETWAANLPIGEGQDFKGIYDRSEKQLHLFERVTGGRYRAPVKTGGMDDPHIKDIIPPAVLDPIAETGDLLDSIAPTFDVEKIAAGKMTPVFFGSAVNNFGVELLLDGFLEHASPPQARKANGVAIPTEEPKFSAFVFKIQANMDPKHRDRLVFMRICSGKFQRDLRVLHTQSGKTIRLSFAHQIFGRDRDTSDEAWPGDIIGITGQTDLHIGDTLTETPDLSFDPIPRFAPECFSYLHQSNSKDHKRFRKGIEQLLQEKVVQQFFPLNSVSRVPLLGAVGPLQFDVVKYRLESEYKVESRLEPGQWTLTRWVHPEDVEAPVFSGHVSGATMAKDEENQLCMLFGAEWNLTYFNQKNPDIRLGLTPYRQTQG